LQTEKRAELVKQLADKGIATGVYYPVPLHLQKAYKDMDYKIGDMPVAEYLSHRTMAVPCFPELITEELAYIADILKELAR
jgi:dTDP-4-amino-4,6-dideoxygalactose transaminase